MTLEPPRHVVVLWGVPGAGKSTFALWLRDQKQFEYVDTDQMGKRDPSGPLELAWIGLIGNRVTPEAFMQAAAAVEGPVVVEYGMYAEEGPIDLLRRLRSQASLALREREGLPALRR